MAVVGKEWRCSQCGALLGKLTEDEREVDIEGTVHKLKAGDRMVSRLCPRTSCRVLNILHLK